MRTIIAATDFSPVALNAVNYAADLARLLTFRLLIIHVYSVPVPVSEVPIPAVSAEELEADASKQLHALKDQLRLRIGSAIDIQAEIRQGEIINEMNDCCAGIQPYAVVLGAESAGAFQRFLFGATTLEAISRIHWPLLIIPPLASFRNIRRVGLACDFKNVSGTIWVREVRQLVEAFNAEMHVVHVNESGDSLEPPSIQQSALLKEMLEPLHPKYHLISEPDVETALLQFAHDIQLDMLIIIPKKHNILNRIVSHSTSKQLVLQADIPLLSIHQNH
jgi:nucleotide-binding universal stress UspA family protein